MRANQSSNASGMYSRLGPHTAAEPSPLSPNAQAGSPQAGPRYVSDASGASNGSANKLSATKFSTTMETTSVPTPSLASDGRDLGVAISAVLSRNGPSDLTSPDQASWPFLPERGATTSYPPSRPHPPEFALGGAAGQGLISAPGLAGPPGRVADGPGLVHDAGNLLGALRLYCDLLAAPGVLRAEHRHYAEEIRQLSGRSGALIDRLMSQWGGTPVVLAGPVGQGTGRAPASPWAEPAGGTASARCAEGLGTVVEQSRAMLRGVAGGRAVEIRLGPAASVPVEVSPESVERILVNLVRNAASALGGELALDGSSASHGASILHAAPASGSASVYGNEARPASVRSSEGLAAKEDTEAQIRIGVGFVVNRANDPNPWICRRVRLTVEDDGPGMSRADLERVTQGTRTPLPGRHGLGLRVVRELVEQTKGDLRMESEEGVGTRIQIEWPVPMVSIEPLTSTTAPSSTDLGPKRLGSTEPLGLAEALGSTAALASTALGSGGLSDPTESLGGDVLKAESEGAGRRRNVPRSGRL